MNCAELAGMFQPRFEIHVTAELAGMFQSRFESELCRVGRHVSVKV